VFVNSAPEFTEQHLVANGASNLIIGVLGDAGRHARSAIGVAGLPRGAAVEIEAILEVG
jgi:enamine deaminase RidA (YjgF/YER057c/UK114 family)